MFRAFLLAALALTFGGPVSAVECPNSITAKAGFVLERRGVQAQVRPTANHFTNVTNVYPDGKRQDVMYYRGLFELSRFDPSWQHFNIPLSDIRSVFPLKDGARRALTYASAAPSKVGETVSLELSVVGRDNMRLGFCSYDVLVIRNRLLNAEGTLLSEYTDLYSPDLGFVLGKRYPEAQGQETSVHYDRIRPLDRN